MKQGKEVKTYDFSVNHTYGCNITGFSSDAEHPLPVCFAGALLFLSLFGDVSMKTMLIWVFSQSTGTVLLASPLFILAGTYMGGSGIAKRLLDCVDAFVGHIKSGLGVVAVLVCAIMGAISGSGFTGVAATGPIMIPKMEEQATPGDMRQHW